MLESAMVYTSFHCSYSYVAQLTGADVLHTNAEHRVTNEHKKT